MAHVSGGHPVRLKQFRLKREQAQHMINAARGEIAYTIIDTDTPVSDKIPTAIAALPDVVRVRVL